MKILLDLQGAQSESRTRGIGRVSRSFARAVIENAGPHEIHILLNGALTANLDELTDEFAKLLPDNHVHRFSYATPIAEIDAQNRWRAQSAVLQREARVSKLRPDLVHITSLFEGYVDDAIVSVSAFRSRHPTSVTLYDLIPLADPARYLANPIYRDYYFRRAQELKKAAHLLSISEYSRVEAIELLQIPPDQISVVPLGVYDVFQPKVITATEEATLRAKWGSDRRIVLHVGATDPRKNVERLIEAFSILPAETRGKHVLVFAGNLSEGERNEIRANADRFGLNAAELRFTGFIDEQELISLYNLCEVLVFPSLHEGFGLPALEAMACGAPVIAANNTSLPEVVGRRDMLFDPWKAEDLAARLVEISGGNSHFGFRSELKAWGVARAKEFTWSKAGKRALEIFEGIYERHRDQTGTAVRFQRKPLLAFVSPLPADQSGIADYSAELLRELALYYEIECIIKDTNLADDWIGANFIVRDAEWFEAHACSYDRILYSMGNSPFHAHMVRLMKRFPGTVVLHDFFLSDLLLWMCTNGLIGDDEFSREVYRSHGLGGSLVLKNKGAQGAAEDLPLNGYVFRNARGIIAHSRYLADLAASLYSESARQELAIIPLLRGVERRSPSRLREQLSIGPHDFLVCSFGMLHPRKLSHLIVQAWIDSELWRNSSCHLVFVGESNPDYHKEIELMFTEDSCRRTVRFIGYADREMYQHFLNTSDVAVQLRTTSRGETSRAILDCMSAALPVIITEIGSSAEYPDQVAIKVPASTTSDDLATALVHLHANPELRREMGARAREYVRSTHHPALVGRAFAEAIELFYRESNRSIEQELLDTMSGTKPSLISTDLDVRRLAESISRDLPFPSFAQILYDVTAIAETDLRTGVERVVRGLLNALVEQPPNGYRIEPVLIRDGVVTYARRFTEERLELPLGGLEDSPVEFGPADHYVVVGWIPDQLSTIEPWLQSFRRAGGTVTMVVHDLLPLEFPQFFPDWIPRVTTNWLQCVLRTADKVACVSATVAKDVAGHAQAFEVKRTTPLIIKHFPLGSDLRASSPSSGVSVEAQHALSECAHRHTFLMVGTVEPRKGHDQVLKAFEILWDEGQDIGLILVGKEGWMVEHVVARIRENQRKGSKLIWLQSASDEVLHELYDAACALLAASLGEGFGLPIIEAASHNLPIIARDIPVFREVAGDHAFYFDGLDADHLAQRLRAWLALYEQNLAPHSLFIKRFDWRTSTERFTDIMIEGNRPSRSRARNPSLLAFAN